MSNTMTQIQEAADYIKKQGVESPELGMILGSGLGEIADEVENPIVIDYHDIPHFPVSTVVGHDGSLVYGDLNGAKVLVMKGRIHYYEGYSLQEVMFPVRVMKALGIEKLMITNAAGGINYNFTPGDLMLIVDQLNFTGTNPLLGPNEDELGPRFLDMNAAFDKEFQQIAHETALEQKIDLKEGVYMGVTGPTYETPAEIRMFRTLGADAVGMSTVFEVIAARHVGMRVLGISCITNLGSGMQTSLNHSEVVATTERVKEKFKTLVRAIAGKMA